MEINISDGRANLWQWDTDRYLSLDTTATEVHLSRKGQMAARIVKIENQKAAIPDSLLAVGGTLCVYLVETDDTGKMTVYNQSFDIRRRPKPNDYIYTDAEIRTWEELEKRIEELEKGGTGGGTTNHEELTNRDAADQHPISSITGLTAQLETNNKAASTAQATADAAAANATKAQSSADAVSTTAAGLGKRLTAAETAIDGKQPKGNYLTEESDPTVPAWAKSATKPTYTAAEVGAIAQDDLQTATNAALAQAKASGIFDGKIPVKGTDYWTNDDKSEIVQETLSALPTWTGGDY